MPITFTFRFGESLPITDAAVAGALAIRDKAFATLTNDLLLDGGGDQVYLKNVDAIASDLKSNWQFFKGEWFLNLNKGIDYWGVIFAKGTTLEQCEEEYRREALATPGIAAVELSLTRTGRRLDVAAACRTDLGQIFQVALGVNAGP